MSGSTTDPTTQQDTGTGNRSYTDTANDQCGRASTQIIINEGKGDKGDKGEPADPAAIEALQAKTADLVVVDGGGTAYTGVVSGATVLNPVTNENVMVAQALGSLNSKVSDVQLKVDNVGDSLTGLTTEVDAVNTKTAKLSADGSKYTGDASGAVLGQIDGKDVIASNLVPFVVNSIQKGSYNRVESATAISSLSSDNSICTIAVGGMGGGNVVLLAAQDADGGLSEVGATPKGAGLYSNKSVTIVTPGQIGAPMDTNTGVGEVRFDDTNNVMWRWNGTKWNGYYSSEGTPLAEDANGAVVVLTQQADGTYAGSGNAQVAYIGTDGKVQNVCALGELLAYFNKAIQPGAAGNTIDEFHLTLPDGSKLDYTEAAGLQLTGRDGKVRFTAGSTVMSLVAYDGTGNATAGILITPSMMLVDAQNNTPYIVSTSAAAPPAPNNVNGQVGEIRFDDNYMYRKVATDKWVRFPVDTTWTA